MPAQSALEITYGIEIECFLNSFKVEKFKEEISVLGFDYGNDGSIMPPINNSAIEIKSPPLPYSEFQNTLLPALHKILKKYNVKANTSCGLHVHASHPRFFKRRYLNRISLTWLAIEDVLFSIQNASRMYNSYCARKLYDFVKRGGLPLFGKTKTSIVKNLYFPRDALNFGAITEHGTIECRTHTGTTNTNVIRNWVYLLNQFYNYIFKEYKPSFIKELKQTRCSMKKVNQVWDLLEIEASKRKHFQSRVNPRLFTRLNRQVATARQVLPFVYKIKWYENKYGFDQVPEQTIGFMNGDERPVTVFGKRVDALPSYKNYLKIRVQKNKILKKFLDSDEYE